MGKKRKISLKEEFQVIYRDNPLSRRGEHNPAPISKYGLCIVTSSKERSNANGGKE